MLAGGVKVLTSRFTAITPYTLSLAGLAIRVTKAVTNTIFIAVCLVVIATAA
jgi:hypothetical protein